MKNDFNIKKDVNRHGTSKSLLRLNKDIKEKNEIIREDIHNTYDVFCKHFLKEVASEKWRILHLEFPECCKPWLPYLK